MLDGGVIVGSEVAVDISSNTSCLIGFSCLRCLDVRINGLRPFGSPEAEWHLFNGGLWPSLLSHGRHQKLLMTVPKNGGKSLNEV